MTFSGYEIFVKSRIYGTLVLNRFKAILVQLLKETKERELNRKSSPPGKPSISIWRNG